MARGKWSYQVPKLDCFNFISGHDAIINIMLHKLLNSCHAGFYRRTRLLSSFLLMRANLLKVAVVGKAD